MAPATIKTVVPSFGFPSLCTAAHSGKRLRSDKNEARVINTCTGIVSIACDLFNKFTIGLKDLFVGAFKVHTGCEISKRLVAHPAKDGAFSVRHPEFYTVAGR